MSTGKAATFTAGLVQMRSGLSPQANLDAAVKLIGEAKNGGADYVQTPEMTNILEVKRERLFAAIVAGGERREPRHLPRACAQARHLSSHRLARHQAVARQGGQPLVPDRPQGRDRRALRQDPHVRRRSRGGESYRESRNYRPGELAVVADLPWGRLGLTICYDLRFPALYRALAEAGARSSPSRRPSRGRPARRIGTCSTAPARSRTAASCSRRRRAASTRTAARPSAIRWWSTRGAASSPRAAPSRAWCWPMIDPAEVAAARASIPSLQHGRRFEMIEPMAEPAHLHAVRGPA